MARIPNAPVLDTGDTFPSLRLQLTQGGEITVPDDLELPFNVILVNRGWWCPFCSAQLRAFQSGLAKLSAEGIGVVSFSVDPLEKAQGVVDKHKLTYPVGYGVNYEEVAGKLGLFYDNDPGDKPPYFQTAGFLLGPDKKVVQSSYSSGPIGRLVWQDVLGMVQYIKSHA